MAYWYGMLQLIRETLQNKAIKLIRNGTYRAHVTPYYKKLNIFK